MSCNNCLKLNKEKSLIEVDFQILSSHCEKVKKNEEFLRSKCNGLEINHQDEIFKLKSIIDDKNSFIKKLELKLKIELDNNKSLFNDLEDLKEQFANLENELIDKTSILKTIKDDRKNDLEFIKSNLTSEQELNAKLQRKLDYLENQKLIQNSKEINLKSKIEELEETIVCNLNKYHEHQMSAKKELSDLKDEIDNLKSSKSTGRIDHKKCNEDLKKKNEVSTKWRKLALKRKNDFKILRDKMKNAPVKKLRIELKTTVTKLISARKEIKEMNDVFDSYKLDQKKKLHELPTKILNNKKATNNKFNTIRRLINEGLNS